MNEKEFTYNDSKSFPYWSTVLGQLPPRRSAANPKTNPNPDSNPYQGGSFPRGQLSGYPGAL